MRAMLIVHAVCAMALVGAATHHLVWSARYLRGQFGRARAEQRFLRIVGLLFAATFTLGLVMYPAYKTGVRMAWLDANRPDIGRLFDIKEHFVAIVFATLCAQAWLAKRARPHAGSERIVLVAYAGLSATTALLVWTAAIIGLITVSIRSFG